MNHLSHIILPTTFLVSCSKTDKKLSVFEQPTITDNDTSYSTITTFIFLNQAVEFILYLTPLRNTMPRLKQYVIDLGVDNQN